MANFKVIHIKIQDIELDRESYQIITLDSKSISSAARVIRFHTNNIYYELNEPLYVDSPTDIFRISTFSEL